MTKRPMTKQEQDRLYRICYNAKNGCIIVVEDEEFIEKMYKMDPEGYGKVSRKASREAVTDYKEMIGGKK